MSLVVQGRDGAFQILSLVGTMYVSISNSQEEELEIDTYMAA